MYPIRTLFSALLLLLLCTTANAQNPACDGIRYKQEVFSAVKKSSLAYATAIGHTGQTINLAMDVYEPEGDTASKRPVVVLEHGGSFIFGNKTDMTSECNLLAKRGYVAVSIQYRLYPVFVLGFPDSSDIMDSAVKAVGDMKAAVRYFREDAATTNLFRADPDHIFIGGYSAGAVAALHAAFLDEDDVFTPFIQNLIDANGGLDGNSGSPSNQTYSSAVDAVVNMSGGLYRRHWITGGEVPVSSIHGTADGTVPYFSGLAADLAYLEGSGLLHSQAQSVGTWSYLKKVPGGGHTDIYDQAQYAAPLNDYWKRTSALLEFMTCYVDTMPEVTTGLPSIVPESQLAWSVFPNPVQQDVFFIQLPTSVSTATATLYDVNGRAMRTITNITSDQTGFNVSDLPQGIYLLQLFDTAKPGQTLGTQRLFIK